MKFNSIFREKLNCQNSEEVFDYLISHLKKSILKWDYFVNWRKAIHNLREVEISLNLLNYLIGKDNIEQEAKVLFKEHPKLVSIVPSLIAYRYKKSISILTDYQSQNFYYEEFIFDKKGPITDKEIDNAVIFLRETGFLEQIASQQIKSLTDYFFGLEVGLDTNGRKNRSGTAMEEIIKYFIDSICQHHNFEYISQATASGIEEKFGKNLTVKHSSKKIDFAINTPQKLYLIETNFYGGGGSKLKATAGEYSNVCTQWKNDGHQFIWITDGEGWLTAKRPLHDAFNKIDYILNLSMVQKEILEALIIKSF